MAIVRDVRGRKTVYVDHRRFFVPDTYSDGDEYELETAAIAPSAERESGALRTLLIKRDIVGEERINALSARLKLLSRHRFTLVETIALIVLHATAMTALFPIDPVPAASAPTVAQGIGRLAFIVLLQAAILALHELAHCATARRLGLRVDSLGVGTYLLLPAMYSRISLVVLQTPRKRIAIYAAGLLVQGEISLVLLATVAIGGNHLVLALFWTNLLTMAFNLLPLSRLDGFRIVVEVMGHPSAPRWSKRGLPVLVRCAGLFSYAIVALVLLNLAAALSHAQNWQAVLAQMPAMLMMAVVAFSMVRLLLRRRRGAH